MLVYVGLDDTDNHESRGTGRLARNIAENLAQDFGVELGGWSFGAQFGDLNNDGTLDLYLANGYISVTPIQLDMTDYRRMDQIRSWNLAL